jgi:uncharacterized protein (TIGR01244 family)
MAFDVPRSVNMPRPVFVGHNIAVGGQPTSEELAQLRQAGFRAVINLRQNGEPVQALSPAEEGRQAAAIGLAYRHVPVSSLDLQPDRVDAFKAAVESLPGPIYVHCGAGQRATALALTYVAPSEGLTGDQTILDTILEMWQQNQLQASQLGPKRNYLT